MLGVLTMPVVAGVQLELAEINGEPGLLATSAGQSVGAISLEVTDGRIAALRLVVNPDKLTGLNLGRRR
jgi:RNA polymerase sigma-70 factor (ECF subfamily)